MENHWIDENGKNLDSRAMKAFRIIGMVFVGLIFAALFALVFGFLVKWLWNFLMPDLFGLKEITYWQAFTIVILSKLIFGTFGHKNYDRHYGQPRYFKKWHDRYHGSEDEPWNRKSKNREIYKRFWQKEGKAAFQDYLMKNTKKGEERLNKEE